ncbi:fatty acid-binding protein like protein 4 [Ditylenchus destructor]|nr:fatty acid-binding protein like protein 4 [Ditylenchus destructor]
MNRELPEKFLGKFKHEKSENFDQYLASRGVNWLLRKMIQFSSVTKVISKSAKEEGRYNMHNITSKESPLWEDWALGESFEAKGFDGKQHKITFDLKGDELTEEHIRLENPEDKAEVYHYTVDDQGQLVLKLENESVIARRWFKRLE